MSSYHWCHGPFEDDPRTQLRADARRNREAIVHAARAVFAEAGLDAPLDAIVRRAGVGRGTLYRRFPSRDDLLLAIHEDNLDSLEAVAVDAPNPDHAFVDVLVAAKEMLVADRGFVELLRRHPRFAADGATRQRSLLDDHRGAAAPRPARRSMSATIFGRMTSCSILDMLGGAALAAGPHRAPDRADRALGLVLDAVVPPAGAHR